MDGDPELPSAAMKALIPAFTTALGVKTLSASQADFARQVADDFQPDEIGGAGPAALTAFLADAWKLALQRKGEAPLVRLLQAKGTDGAQLKLDLLVVVQDDKPFLVDSIMGELGEGGFGVEAMFHPVVTLGGRDTSVILVLLDPVGEDRRDALIEGVEATLSDAAAAVGDFTRMTALMAQAIAELGACKHAEGPYGLREYLDFLQWVTADRFVFLGARTYDYPRLPHGDYAAEEPKFRPEDGMGVLRDPARSVLRRASEPAVLAPGLAAYLKDAAPVVVAKSNLRSRVHRRTNMDYIGVKRYGPDGAAIGEVRFVGLFTAEAYEEPAQTLPLIRRKIESVLRRAGENPSAHTEKRLRHIVDAYPRDELFQIEEDELFDTAMGILHLSDRPRVRLFARNDPFDRFVSVLLYIPRDRYDSGVRQTAGALLAEAWGGRVSAVYLNLSDQPLTRLHFIIGVSPGDHPEPDLRAIESLIAEGVRTWSDRFGAQARGGGVETGRVREVLARYAGAFPAGYRDRYSPDEAMDDLHVIEALAPPTDGTVSPLRIRAYRKATDSKLSFRVKLYRAGTFVPLADVLPIFENMGLKALTEDGFALKRIEADGATTPVWVHEFELEDERGEKLNFHEVKAPFEAAFDAIWTGRTESDGFNRLVLELGVSWREAALVRAFARYRLQSGLDPSQSVQEQTLSAYPGVVRLILDMFKVKFDPAVTAPPRPASNRPRRSSPRSPMRCRRWRASTPTGCCGVWRWWCGR